MVGFAAINDQEGAKGGAEGNRESQEAQEARLVATYERAIALTKDGNSDVARELLGQLLKEPLLENAGMLSASMSRLRYLARKNLAALLGPSWDALKLYSEASSDIHAQKDEGLWGHIAQLAMSLQCLPVARYAYERGLQCQPLSLTWWERLCEALLVVGDWQALGGATDHILTLSPRHPWGDGVRAVAKEKNTGPTRTAPHNIWEIEDEGEDDETIAAKRRRLFAVSSQGRDLAGDREVVVVKKKGVEGLLKWLAAYLTGGGTALHESPTQIGQEGCRMDVRSRSFQFQLTCLSRAVPGTRGAVSSNGAPPGVMTEANEVQEVAGGKWLQTEAGAACQEEDKGLGTCTLLDRAVGAPLRNNPLVQLPGPLAPSVIPSTLEVGQVMGADVGPERERKRVCMEVEGTAHLGQNKPETAASSARGEDEDRLGGRGEAGALCSDGAEVERDGRNSSVLVVDKHGSGILDTPLKPAASQGSQPVVERDTPNRGDQGERRRSGVMDTPRRTRSARAVEGALHDEEQHLGSVSPQVLVPSKVDNLIASCYPHMVEEEVYTANCFARWRVTQNLGGQLVPPGSTEEGQEKTVQGGRTDEGDGLGDNHQDLPQALIQQVAALAFQPLVHASVHLFAHQVVDLLLNHPELLPKAVCEALLDIVEHLKSWQWKSEQHLLLAELYFNRAKESGSPKPPPRPVASSKSRKLKEGKDTEKTVNGEVSCTPARVAQGLCKYHLIMAHSGVGAGAWQFTRTGQGQGQGQGQGLVAGMKRKSSDGVENVFNDPAGTELFRALVVAQKGTESSKVTPRAAGTEEGRVLTPCDSESVDVSWDCEDDECGDVDMADSGQGLSFEPEGGKGALVELQPEEADTDGMDPSFAVRYYWTCARLAELENQWSEAREQYTRCVQSLMALGEKAAFLQREIHDGAIGVSPHHHGCSVTLDMETLECSVRLMSCSQDNIISQDAIRRRVEALQHSLVMQDAELMLEAKMYGELVDKLLPVAFPGPVQWPARGEKVPASRALEVLGITPLSQGALRLLEEGATAVGAPYNLILFRCIVERVRQAVVMFLMPADSDVQRGQQDPQYLLVDRVKSLLEALKTFTEAVRKLRSGPFQCDDPNAMMIDSNNGSNDEPEAISQVDLIHRLEPWLILLLKECYEQPHLFIPPVTAAGGGDGRQRGRCLNVKHNAQRMVMMECSISLLASHLADSGPGSDARLSAKLISGMLLLLGDRYSDAAEILPWLKMSFSYLLKVTDHCRKRVVQARGYLIEEDIGEEQKAVAEKHSGSCEEAVTLKHVEETLARVVYFLYGGRPDDKGDAKGKKHGGMVPTRVPVTSNAACQELWEYLGLFLGSVANFPHMVDEHLNLQDLLAAILKQMDGPPEAILQSRGQLLEQYFNEPEPEDISLLTLETPIRIHEEAALLESTEATRLEVLDPSWKMRSTLYRMWDGERPAGDRGLLTSAKADGYIQDYLKYLLYDLMYNMTRPDCWERLADAYMDLHSRVQDEVIEAVGVEEFQSRDDLKSRTCTLWRCAVRSLLAARQLLTQETHDVDEKLALLAYGKAQGHLPVYDQVQHVLLKDDVFYRYLEVARQYTLSASEDLKEEWFYQYLLGKLMARGRVQDPNWGEHSIGYYGRACLFATACDGGYTEALCKLHGTRLKLLCSCLEEPREEIVALVKRHCFLPENITLFHEGAAEALTEYSEMYDRDTQGERGQMRKLSLSQDSSKEMGDNDEDPRPSSQDDFNISPPLEPLDVDGERGTAQPCPSSQPDPPLQFSQAPTSLVELHQLLLDDCLAALRYVQRGYWEPGFYHPARKYIVHYYKARRMLPEALQEMHHFFPVKKQKGALFSINIFRLQEQQLAGRRKLCRLSRSRSVSATPDGGKKSLSEDQRLQAPSFLWGCRPRAELKISRDEDIPSYNTFICKQLLLYLQLLVETGDLDVMEAIVKGAMGKDKGKPKSIQGLHKLARGLYICLLLSIIQEHVDEHLEECLALYSTERKKENVAKALHALEALQVHPVSIAPPTNVVAGQQGRVLMEDDEVEVIATRYNLAAHHPGAGTHETAQPLRDLPSAVPKQSSSQAASLTVVKAGHGQPEAPRPRGILGLAEGSVRLPSAKQPQPLPQPAGGPLSGSKLTAGASDVDHHTLLGAACAVSQQAGSIHRLPQPGNLASTSHRETVDLTTTDDSGEDQPVAGTSTSNKPQVSLPPPPPPPPPLAPPPAPPPPGPVQNLESPPSGPDQPPAIPAAAPGSHSVPHPAPAVQGAPRGAPPGPYPVPHPPPAMPEASLGPPGPFSSAAVPAAPLQPHPGPLPPPTVPGAAPQPPPVSHPGPHPPPAEPCAGPGSHSVPHPAPVVPGGPQGASPGPLPPLAGPAAPPGPYPPPAVRTTPPGPCPVPHPPLTVSGAPLRPVPVPHTPPAVPGPLGPLGPLPPLAMPGTPPGPQSHRPVPGPPPRPHPGPHPGPNPPLAEPTGPSASCPPLPAPAAPPGPHPGPHPAPPSPRAVSSAPPGPRQPPPVSAAPAAPHPLPPVPLASSSTASPCAPLASIAAPAPGVSTPPLLPLEVDAISTTALASHPTTTAALAPCPTPIPGPLPPLPSTSSLDASGSLEAGTGPSDTPSKPSHPSGTSQPSGVNPQLTSVSGALATPAKGPRKQGPMAGHPSEADSAKAWAYQQVDRFLHLLMSDTHKKDQLERVLLHAFLTCVEGSGRGGAFDWLHDVEHPLQLAIQHTAAKRYLRPFPAHLLDLSGQDTFLFLSEAYLKLLKNSNDMDKCLATVARIRKKRANLKLAPAGLKALSSRLAVVTVGVFSDHFNDMKQQLMKFSGWRVVASHSRSPCPTGEQNMVGARPEEQQPLVRLEAPGEEARGPSPTSSPPVDSRPPLPLMPSHDIVMQSAPLPQQQGDSMDVQANPGPGPPLDSDGALTGRYDHSVLVQSKGEAGKGTRASTLDATDKGDGPPGQTDQETWAVEDQGQRGNCTDVVAMETDTRDLPAIEESPAGNGEPAPMSTLPIKGLAPLMSSPRLEVSSSVAAPPPPCPPHAVIEPPRELVELCVRLLQLVVDVRKSGAHTLLGPQQDSQMNLDQAAHSALREVAQLTGLELPEGTASLSGALLTEECCFMIQRLAARSSQGPRGPVGQQPVLHKGSGAGGHGTFRRRR